MRKTILFLTISFLSFQVQGSSIFADTTQPQKPWKISKQEFLIRYGKDDTAKAIIQHFFSIRKAGQIASIAGAIITTGLGIYFDRVIVNGDGSGGIGGLIGLFVALGLATSIWTIGIYTLLGVCFWIGYPRKKLWRILNDYYSGKGIPQGLKKIFNKKNL